jgi:hypothetical protein
MNGISLENKYYIVMSLEEGTRIFCTSRYNDDIEEVLWRVFEVSPVFVSKHLIKCEGDIIDLEDPRVLYEQDWLWSIAFTFAADWSELTNLLTSKDYKLSVYDKEQLIVEKGK